MPEEFKIPLTNTLIQAIGDYLIKRPYQEVAMLISGLQQEVQAGVSQPGSQPNGPQPEPLQESPSDTIRGDLQ